MTDKINDNLSLSNSPFSEHLLDDILSTDNSSKSRVKDLPNEPINMSSSSDIPIIKNSLDLNSVDR